MGEDLNPFTPSATSAIQATAPVAQAIAIEEGTARTGAMVDVYIAAKGLTVPLRSSVIRTMVAGGSEGAVAAGMKANLAVQITALGIAAGHSTYSASKEALNGQCSPAFRIR